MRFLRWAFFCLCFLVFPLVVINLGVRHAFALQWEAYTVREAAQVTRLMEKTLQNGVPEHFYFTWLNRMVERTIGTRDPLPRLLAMASQAKARFPDLLDLYVTDGKGNCAWPERIPPLTSRYQIRRLFQCFQSRSALTAGLDDKTNVRLLSHFWGDKPPSKELATQNANRRVTQIFPTGRRTWFYWYSGSRVGLFAHVHRQGARPWYPLAVQIAHLNRVHRRLVGGITTLGGTPRAPRLSRGEARLVTLAISRIDTSPRAWTVMGDRLVTMLPLDTTFRFWTMRRLDPTVRGELWSRRLALVSGLVLLLTTAAAFLVMVLEWEVPIPIRGRLIGLFGIATGLPLVVLLASGFDYLSQTETRLVKETRDALQESLKSFDAKFPKILSEYQAILNAGLKASYLPSGAFDFQQFLGRLVSRRASLGNVHSPAMIFRDGKVVEGPTAEPGKRKHFDRLLKGMGLESLRAYNQNMGFGADTLQTRQVVSAEALLLEGEDAQSLLHGFMGRIGEITRVQFAGTDRFIYFDLILNPRGVGEAIVLLVWPTDDLYLAYLRRNLLARQRDLSGSRMYAVSLDSPRFDMPPRLPRTGWLGTFLDRVRTRNTPLVDQVEIDGIPHLTAGMPGKELLRHVLIQTIPLTGIFAEVRRLHRSLLVFGFLSFALSIAVAVSLARQFLAPISALTAGVREMREGKFRHRITVFDRDELGDLSAAFNSTMESLEQLSVAKTIQERLFPHEPLTLPGFTIHGRSVTASELGGDYFDYFPLGPDRAVILIGDVAGHGVASALLMAMAKAIVTQEARRDPRPSSVLLAVNRMIFDSLQKRSMMTFFYGLLEAGPATLTFANAGHNSPYRFTADGGVGELPATGFPLGTRRNATFTEESLQLGPGDDVWFYTDGIVETPSPDGPPLGYDGTIALFRGTRGDPPEERIRQVYRSCEAWRKGLAQPDDMTVILLAREPPATRPGPPS